MKLFNNIEDNMGNKYENVVDRLEETYNFDTEDDFLCQFCFTMSYSCDNISILFDNIVLFSTVDDGEYKPCENTYTYKYGFEFSDCDNCETNCQEWSEDDIYDMCIKRLSTLGDALRLKTEEKTPVVSKDHEDRLSKKEIKDIIDDTV